jgi:polar amino acid transport system substrate-binding protein
MSLAVLIAGLLATFVVGGCGDDDSSSTGSDSSSGIASTDDLAGKIVGAQDGTTGETYANDETDAAEVRGFPEGPDALAALKTGQVEAVIIDQPVAEDAIDKEGGFEIVQEIPTGEFYGYALGPESPNLRAAVNQALTDLVDDGTYADIYGQYFDSEPPESVGTETNDDAAPEGDPDGTLELVEEGKLTVGTDTPYPPFEIGQPPDISGFDIDLLNAIAEQIGLTPEYTDTSFDTIFRDTASGQYDIEAAASTITPAREKVVDFSNPYYESQQSLVVATG